MRIYTVNRPYTLTFRNTGARYPLSAEETQRLLDEYPAVSATRARVVLQGHNTARAADRTVLTAATIGGGPAFMIER